MNFFAKNKLIEKFNITIKIEAMSDVFGSFFNNRLIECAISHQIIQDNSEKNIEIIIPLILGELNKTLWNLFYDHFKNNNNIDIFVTEFGGDKRTINWLLSSNNRQQFNIKWSEKTCEKMFLPCGKYFIKKKIFYIELLIDEIKIDKYSKETKVTISDLFSCR